MLRKRLERAGAVPLKKAVYALPSDTGTRERAEQVLELVRAAGGEGVLCEATFAQEADAEALRAFGRQRREKEYERIAAEARAAATGGALTRLTREIARVEAIDYFGAAGRRDALDALRVLRRHDAGTPPAPSQPGSSLAGRIWVTRRGLHVDRLACAWVIRRHIDPDAAFRFADAAMLRRGPQELTFDVPDGDITHDAGRCSVENLVLTAGIEDRAVTRIAEIVHDIDLGDDRFRHPETAGVRSMVTGIAKRFPDDEDRLARGLALFDDLYRSFASVAAAGLEKGRGGARSHPTKRKV